MFQLTSPSILHFFCITGRWPNQPNHVTVNTANFSCEGFTGTFDGPSAHSPKKVNAGSFSPVPKVQHFKIDCIQYINQQQSISCTHLALFQLLTANRNAEGNHSDSTKSTSNTDSKPKEQVLQTYELLCFPNVKRQPTACHFKKKLYIYIYT